MQVQDVIAQARDTPTVKRGFGVPARSGRSSSATAS